MIFADVLQRLGINAENSGVYAGGWIDRPGGEMIESLNPATGEVLARVRGAADGDYHRAAESAAEACGAWRQLPPPHRGEIVRRIGVALRQHKSALGLLVMLEVGKIRSEGLGEIQEMIDMADFAVGLSRQPYGLTI